MKSLCVYCSSSDRLEAKYYRAAEELGAAIALRGISLVYGGGNTGIMGSLARAVKSHGGRVVGVIPDFMVQKELAYADADEMIAVTTLRDRKQIMESRADAFLALPGGWGTLEEILEILTLRQLDVLLRPCVLLNQDGFYDDLLKLFARMTSEHFTKPSVSALFHVACTVEQVFEHLDHSPVVAETKWFETS
jgi:cytokinin riboside 5'-monophosphate phosphoribohydrolase